jgi:hypothetical protein
MVNPGFRSDVGACAERCGSARILTRVCPVSDRLARRCGRFGCKASAAPFALVVAAPFGLLRGRCCWRRGTRCRRNGRHAGARRVRRGHLPAARDPAGRSRSRGSRRPGDTGRAGAAARRAIRCHRCGPASVSAAGRRLRCGRVDSAASNARRGRVRRLRFLLAGGKRASTCKRGSVDHLAPAAGCSQTRQRSDRC